MAKDTGMRIRVERELRDAFIETCRAKDLPAAQVLREYMRHFVAKNPPRPAAPAQDNQQSLNPIRIKGRKTAGG